MIRDNGQATQLLDSQLQQCWLERANIARKANQLDNAYGELVF